jgi:hypothetical protein
MEFGLFSAAKPNKDLPAGVGDKWIRGFEADYESRPNYVRVWDQTSNTNFVAYTDILAPRYAEIKPYFLEVEDNATTMALLGLNRFERVLRQLEAATQRTIEHEFHDGHIARGQSLTNPYLCDSNTLTILNAGTAIPPHHAIAFLERGISNYSASGEQGILHMTRDIATLLGSQYMLMRVEDDPGHIHIETNGGTTVVLGSGYSGSGPVVKIATTSALVSSTNFTFTTTKPHYVAVGESVLVEGLTGVQSVLNGTYTAVAGTTGSTVVITLAAPLSVAANAAVTGAYAQMQASGITKWIYASGYTTVILGESEVVNDNLAQAYAVTNNNNDMRIKATRAAVAYFDTSIHLAVKVDLSTTAI